MAVTSVSSLFIYSWTSERSKWRFTLSNNTQHLNTGKQKISFFKMHFKIAFLRSVTPHKMYFNVYCAQKGHKTPRDSFFLRISNHDALLHKKARIDWHLKNIS